MKFRMAFQKGYFVFHSNAPSVAWQSLQPLSETMYRVPSGSKQMPSALGKLVRGKACRSIRLPWGEYSANKALEAERMN